VERRMSFTQRLFTRLFPRAAESMRAHSLSWMVQCARCGFERSIWDMGGIRWKAVGNQRIYQRCVQCGRRNWHKCYRKSESVADQAISQG
jgi:hypothetical protein